MITLYLHICTEVGGLRESEMDTWPWTAFKIWADCGASRYEPAQLVHDRAHPASAHHSLQSRLQDQSGTSGPEALCSLEHNHQPRGPGFGLGAFGTLSLSHFDSLQGITSKDLLSYVYVIGWMSQRAHRICIWKVARASLYQIVALWTAEKENKGEKAENSGSCDLNILSKNGLLILFCCMFGKILVNFLIVTLFHD